MLPAAATGGALEHHRAPSTVLHDQKSFSVTSSFSVAALRRRAWEHAEAIAAEAAAAAFRRHQLQVLGAAAAVAAISASGTTADVSGQDRHTVSPS